MVDLLNGQGRAAGPLAGYVIAVVGSLTLIGLRTGETLSPVYELKTGMQQTREGINIQHGCFPVMLLGSLDSIDLPVGALIIPIESLSRTERASLAAGVENGAQMVRAMRAAAAGVVLAPAGTKLPPSPGTR